MIDLVLDAVCGDCNHTFFNDLQAAARPFLIPAIGGEPVRLSIDLKKAMAAWAYKTALLIPLTMTPRRDWSATVGALCSGFRNSRRPPIDARIWCGRYDLKSQFPELVARADVSELGVTRLGVAYKGQHVLMSFGYLMVAVMFWPSGGPDEVPRENERFPTTHFIRLWPVSVQDSAWPPRHTFHFSELDGLSTWTA